MNYNHVTIIGRLISDPDLIEIKNEKRCSFRVGIDRPYKDSAGKSETDFLQVVAWNKLAEVCGLYLLKHRLVLVDGSISTRKYEKDGQMHYLTEIEASSIKFLEPQAPQN